MNTESSHAIPEAEAALLLGPSAEEASGEVDAIYQATRKAFGFLPNAARLLATSPPLLAHHMRHIGYYSQHPTLGAPLLAFIRLLVSDRARCRYCVHMNAAMLMQAGISPEGIEAAREDPESAPLPARERALLGFALAAVSDPHAIGEHEMVQVRAQGWSDGEILDAVYHGASAVAVDIVLDTFNVPAD